MKSKRSVVLAGFIPALLTIALVVVVITGACDSTATGVKTYADADYGYSFEYPGSWKSKIEEVTPATVSNSGGAPAWGQTVSEVYVYDKDVDRDLVWVTVAWGGSLPPDTDGTAQALASAKSNIEASTAIATGWTMVEALAEASIGGMSGFKATFTYSADGVPATFTQYWLYSGAMEYRVWVQATDEDWNAMQPVFDALLASLKPGTQAATITTLRPTATTQQPTTTEPPPVAVVLPGYEQVTVRTVSVVIDDSYPGIEGDAIHPLNTTVVAALEAMGLVAIDAGVDCDATLTFELEGQAISATYKAPEGNFTEWSGATYIGTAAFEVAGLDGERWEVSARREPPNFISGDYPRDYDAPFEEVFLGPLLTTLARVWGPEKAIQTIGIWPAFDNVIKEDAGDWVVSVATEVTPRLMEMRFSQEYGPGPSQTIGYRAYHALALLVAREAVPVEDQSVIVRTLISDYKEDPFSPAGQALPGITVDDDGNVLPDSYRWDAQAWTDWADAQGY